MRFLLVFVVACNSAPASPACERARDRALVQQQKYVDEVMAETPDDQKPGLLRQAAQEAAKLEKNFVAACIAAAADHPPCFVRPETEREPACFAFTERVARATLKR